MEWIIISTPIPDSIHMLNIDEEELKSFVDIDEFRLGAWKVESRFRRGSYIRQKCYIEEEIISEKDYKKLLDKVKDEKEKISLMNDYKYYKDKNYYGIINITIAGLPKKLRRYVNFDNFKVGFSLLASDTSVEHKLTYKHVDGGVMLVETDFTIK